MMTKQTHETILQSVGSQVQCMNTTIEIMKAENDDNHRRMDEQITTMEKDDHAGRPKQQKKRIESERHGRQQFTRRPRTREEPW